MCWLVLWNIFLIPEIVIPAVVIGIIMGIILYYCLKREAKKEEECRGIQKT